MFGKRRHPHEVHLASQRCGGVGEHLTDGMRIVVRDDQDRVLGPEFGELREATVRNGAEFRVHTSSAPPSNSRLTASIRVGSVNSSAPVAARHFAARTMARSPAGLAAASANSRVWADTPSGTMAMYGWMAGTTWLRLPKSDEPTPPVFSGSYTLSPSDSRWWRNRPAMVRLMRRSAYSSPSSSSTVAPTAAAA